MTHKILEINNLKILIFWHKIAYNVYKISIMDTKISRKTNKKKYLFIALPIFLILGYLIFASLTKKRSLNIKKAEISIKTVEEGFFEDFLVFQARVEPMNVMLVNIIEGGAVQEIYVGNGDMVAKGQSLARLYNPNSELNYMQQETAIIEQINNLNKAKLDLRNQELNLTKDLIAIEHDYLDSKNLYDLNKKLFDQEIIAKNDWQITQENYRFQKERMNIVKQSVTKVKQANAVFSKAQEDLRNARVPAPIAGRIGRSLVSEGALVGWIERMMPSNPWVLAQVMNAIMASKAMPWRR